MKRSELKQIIREEYNKVEREQRKLQEGSIPENIRDFAVRKGVLDTVNQINRWANKNNLRIVGGTAIGKNYSTLVLDLTYQGSEVYYNIDTDVIKVNGQVVKSAKDFADALKK